MILLVVAKHTCYWHMTISLLLSTEKPRQQVGACTASVFNKALQDNCEYLTRKNIILSLSR